MRDINPPSPSERPQNARRTAARLFRYVLQQKKTFVFLLLVAFVSIALDIMLPLLIEGCIDALNIMGGLTVDASRFFSYFAAMLLTVTASAVLGWLHGVLSSRLTLRITATLRAELFDKIAGLPLAESERRMPGDLMSRVMNDTPLAAGAFSESVLTLASNGVVIVGCMVVMLVKSATLTGITVAASTASLLVTALASRFLFPLILARQTALGTMNTHFEESLNSFRSAVAFGRADENRRLTDRYTGDLYRKSVKAMRVESLLNPLMMLFGNMNFLLVIVFGAKSVLAQVITIGTLQAFVLYSRQLSEPVIELSECFAKIQSAFAGAERVFALMDRPPEPQTAGKAVPAPDSGDGIPQIVYDNVSFGYNRKKIILNNVSFTIRKGERVAIVGATGSGKTTIVSLLLRLYDGYEGSILLNGAETKEMDLRALRSAVTVVPQEPQIISGSVTENILYGVDDAGPEDAVRAAKVVGLHEIVERLSDGYDTVLRSGGETISQGQLQLICLARSLLRDSEILILDESTSSVDVATEEEVTDGLAVLTRGKTCIVIAHRISSVRDADRILVVSDGQIAAEGTHEQLLADCAVYRTLFKQNDISDM